jgi:hypothetical protein
MSDTSPLYTRVKLLIDVTDLTESEQQHQLGALAREGMKERAKFEEARAKRAKRSWTGKLSSNVNEDIEMQDGPYLTSNAQSPARPPEQSSPVKDK